MNLQGNMCVLEVRKYTCGCTKNEEFRQCEARRGTNVKCTPVRKVDLLDSSHMCINHMVKVGKDEMHR